MSTQISLRTVFIFAGLLAIPAFAAETQSSAPAKPDAPADCCTKDAACCGKDKACCAKDAAACCTDAKGCCELVQHYLPISEALAADDLGKAKTAAALLGKEADADGMTTIADAAKAVAKADSIAVARAAFKKVSAEMTPLAEGTKGLVVMNCPMADADWIQTDEKVRNPYYGKTMLRCGAPKKAKE